MHDIGQTYHVFFRLVISPWMLLYIDFSQVPSCILQTERLWGLLGTLAKPKYRLCLHWVLAPFPATAKPDPEPA